MSHLNTAYLYGIQKAAADFAAELNKLAELQAGAPPKTNKTPIPAPALQTQQGAKQAPVNPPLATKKETQI